MRSPKTCAQVLCTRQWIATCTLYRRRIILHCHLSGRRKELEGLKNAGLGRLSSYSVDDIMSSSTGCSSGLSSLHWSMPLSCPPNSVQSLWATLHAPSSSADQTSVTVRSPDTSMAHSRAEERSQAFVWKADSERAPQSASAVSSVRCSVVLSAH